MFSNSRIFAARLSVRGRVSVFAAFSTPCSGGFHNFLQPHSSPICRLTLVNLGANRPFVRPPFFRLPTAPQFGGFHVSILAGSSRSITSFRRFRYLLAGSRISSHTSSHHSVMSLPHLLYGHRKLFLLRRSSGSSDCRIEFAIIFTSHFVFWKNLLPVPFRHWSDFIPVPIRRGSVLLTIVPFHRRTRCSLINFNKSLRSVSAS